MIISAEKTHEILKFLVVGILQQETNQDPIRKSEPVSLLNPYICLCAYYVYPFPVPQTLHDFVVWLHTPVTVDEDLNALGEQEQ